MKASYTSSLRSHTLDLDPPQHSLQAQVKTRSESNLQSASSFLFCPLIPLTSKSRPRVPLNFGHQNRVGQCFLMTLKSRVSAIYPFTSGRNYRALISSFLTVKFAGLRPFSRLRWSWGVLKWSQQLYANWLPWPSLGQDLVKVTNLRFLNKILPFPHKDSRGDDGEL